MVTKGDDEEVVAHCVNWFGCWEDVKLRVLETALVGVGVGLDFGCR